jgi:hypothetical protein
MIKIIKTPSLFIHSNMALVFLYVLLGNSIALGSSSDIGAAPTTDCVAASAGWPVFNNGANHENSDQICGNGYASGSLSIGGDKTHSWTNYEPDSSSNWEWYDGCYYVNDSNVVVTTTGIATINPWSATATNWLPAESSNTRYWSSGALWGTGMEVDSIAQGDWFWAGNQGNSSGYNSASVLLWTHGCSATGTMQMSNYYGAYVNSTAPSTASVAVISNPVQAAMTPRNSKQSEFRIVEKQVNLPSDFAGGNIAELKSNCPKGFLLMNSSVLSLGPIDNATIRTLGSGIAVSATQDMAGESLKSQVVCRKNRLRKILKGQSYWGTNGADIIKNGIEGVIYYGGPGADKITASGDFSQVFGGQGNDKLNISGKDSVGIGGPGNDLLRAIGGFRIRLEGGEGKDKLFGSVGNTHLDARDGKPDDQVTCIGNNNIAIVDEGDLVTGNCAQIIRNTY